MITKIESQLDKSPLAFGKYRGQTPEEIAKTDPSYIVWLYENVSPRRCSKDLVVACEQEDRDYEEEKYQDAYFGLDGL